MSDSAARTDTDLDGKVSVAPSFSCTAGNFQCVAICAVPEAQVFCLPGKKDEQQREQFPLVKWITAEVRQKKRSGSLPRL
ncbi:hypothetical protein WG922_07340 [Ramlibacter sp. AN1015]|uniref:hypothetical protein n=1 Tax=Ramlibacter sp. AN1015 TaxID=3133428 RepID=UPI0030BD9446